MRLFQLQRFPLLNGEEGDLLTSMTQNSIIIVDPIHVNVGVSEKFRVEGRGSLSGLGVVVLHVDQLKVALQSSNYIVDKDVGPCIHRADQSIIKYFGGQVEDAEVWHRATQHEFRHFPFSCPRIAEFHSFKRKCGIVIESV